MIHKPKHIGIVGCSAEGAALCYKSICTHSPKILGAHAHPEISMHTHSLAEYVKCLEANDIEGVGRLMLLSAEKLKSQGAEFLICPDNTIHQAFDFVEKRSPLPWLHIANEVVKSAQQNSYNKLGILGTQWLLESDVYPQQIEQLSLDWLRPQKQMRVKMGQIIMDELVYGVLKTESISFFQEVIDNLKSKGCDAVILGCTEIPLIINETNSALPILDSNFILSQAAMNHSILEGSFSH